LQIVVLFASDPKVLQYSKTVQSKFTRHGIDVFLNTTLNEVGLTSAAVGNKVARTASSSSQWIRPDHLSVVISATKADFLIVIGDRNMRNETCQGRRSGKLVEMPVADRLESMLLQWAEEHGVDTTLHDVDGRISSELLSDRLHAYTGLTRSEERTSKLEADAETTHGWSRPVLRPGQVVSDHDAAMASLVTQLQTRAIRLHKELVAAIDALQGLPVLPKGASLSQALAFRMGLGIGRTVDASFRPAPENVHEARPSGHIPLVLRDLLVGRCALLQERVETVGSTVSSSAGGEHSLWSAYRLVSCCGWWWNFWRRINVSVNHLSSATSLKGTELTQQRMTPRSPSPPHRHCVSVTGCVCRTKRQLLKKSLWRQRTKGLHH
jgi:hypothetical protein